MLYLYILYYRRGDILGTDRMLVAFFFFSSFSLDPVLLSQLCLYTICDAAAAAAERRGIFAVLRQEGVVGRAAALSYSL